MNELLSVPATSHIALKEWAAVCTAIGSGEQQLLFRTGGIEEIETGFEPKHSSFWMFPTRFHQSAEFVTSDFLRRYETIEKTDAFAASQTIPVQVFCKVLGVFRVSSLDQLASLRPWHILQDSVLEQRFHYRSPGIFVLLIQGFRRPKPYDLTNTSAFDGCQSWIEMGDALSTLGLQPVLPEEVWTSTRACVSESLLRK